MASLTPDLGDVNDAADEWNAAWLGILTGSLDAATRNPSRPLDAIDEFLLGRIATANDAQDGA